MRILFFSEPTWPLHPGGAGRCSFVYAAELVRRGHEVVIVCPGHSLTVEMIAGVEIHRVPVPRTLPAKNLRLEENGFARGFYNYARDYVLNTPLDLVVDFGGFLSYFFSVTSEIRRLHQVPVLVYFHLLEDDPEQNPLHFFTRMSQVLMYDFSGPREYPQCFAVRSADAVVCLTDKDAATVQRLYRPAHAYVLPPPVDPRLLQATPSLPSPFIHKDKREYLIVFAGRVNDRNKGAAIVRKALERVLAIRKDVRLIVIGQASKKTFRSLGSQVTLTGWINDSATLAGWLRSADVLLMPSRHESFGLMCAEALALGLPVIASPLAGLRKMVVHAHNGYLLQGHHRRRWPKEISDLFLGLLNDPTLLARMKCNAADQGAQFTAAALGGRFEDICLDTVRRKASVQLLQMPKLEGRSRSDYLSLLKTIGGREAQSAGEALLPLLGQNSDTRCRACYRRGIASHIRRVAGRARWFRTARKARVRRAVFATCPWSVAMLIEETRIARETGRISFVQLWYARALFFLARCIVR